MKKGGPRQASRCEKMQSSRATILRAEVGGDKRKAVIEIGNAVVLPSGFALGALSTGAETRALIIWLDGKGGEKRVDLGRVHGAVEAPLLLAHEKELIVALTDNDAQFTTIRLARISEWKRKPQVTWGPEFSTQKDESSIVSMASLPGAVAGGPDLIALSWADYDKSQIRSQIKLVTLSPRSMMQVGEQRVISGSGEDAIAPRLQTRPGGVWATWLTYGKISTDSPVDSSLVREPPRYLTTQKLGSTGAREGKALTLSSKNERVLVFDALSYGKDSLFVAFRETLPGHAWGTSPLRARLVGLDGSIRNFVFPNDKLGPGAPFILSSDKESPWLVSRGEEDRVLLGALDDEGAVRNFSLEPSIRGQIPLTRRGSELLTIEPVGLDLRLNLFRCLLDKD